MPSMIRKGLLLGACLFLVGAPGCATFDLRKDIPWPMGDDPDFTAPTKVVAIWTETVLQRPGRPSTRGFGGRLMFYNSQDTEPLKVDGGLVIYGFDEQGRKPNDVKPDRKFVFTRDQLPEHYSKSKIGHSYSVWVPWDKAGGPKREISLIVRFTPAEGTAIVGEQTRHVLAGPPALDEAPEQAAPGGVEQASYETGTAETTGTAPTGAVKNGNSQRMTTTTIQVPRRFGRSTPQAVPRRPTATAPAARPASASAGRPPQRAAATATPVSRSRPAAPRPVRSSVPGPRVPGEPIAPRAVDRAPSQPHPAGSWSRPPT